MKIELKSFSILLITLILGLGLLTTGAFAQGAIGVVDTQAVESGYDKLNDQLMALQTEVQARQAEMEALSQYLLLPDAEWAEAKSLLSKPLAERTEAELGRIGALAQQMNTILSEWRQLSSKQPLTPEEKTNFDAINARKNTRSAEMGEMETSYNAIFKERAQTIFTNARTQILAAVAQVAQQQQMSIVVERGAVLYGGVNITDPVIKFINDAYAIEKAAPPAGATTEPAPAPAPAPADGGAGGGQG